MSKKKGTTETDFFDLLNETLDLSGETGDHGDGGRGWIPIDDRDMKVGEVREEVFNCYIDRVEFDPTGIEFKDGDEKKTDPLVLFHYTIIDGEHEGRSFKGERFWIPQNCPPPATDGQQKARTIEQRRLVGHYETLTGKEGGDRIGNMIREMLAVCNNEGHTVAAEVKVQVRCYEGNKSRKSASGEDAVTEKVARKSYREYLTALLDVERPEAADQGE